MPKMTAQNALANIALCQVIFWADAVPAETRLNGIGRLLGFDLAPETEVIETIAAPQHVGLATVGSARTYQSPGTSTMSKARTGNARTGTQRAARSGSRREGLLNLIRRSDGLTRGDILQHLGLKGDKAAEMSVSNALTALKKRNEVRSEDGKYYATIETVQQGTMRQQEPQTKAA